MKEFTAKDIALPIIKISLKTTKPV